MVVERPTGPKVPHANEKDDKVSRLTIPAYEDMTPEQRAVHDEITSGPRGSVRGPFIPWLATPAMAARAQKLGEYYRFQTSIPRDLAEIAVMVTGAHYKAEFEWWAHSRMAAEAGVAAEVIKAIREGREPPHASDKARATWQVATALNKRHRLSDAEFAEAKATLGEAGLMDVIGLCGYYALVSLTLNAYEIDTPDNSRAFP